MEGVAKVIDELILGILTKDIDLRFKLQQDEIDGLRRNVERIERYLSIHEDVYDYNFTIKK